METSPIPALPAAVYKAAHGIALGLRESASVVHGGVRISRRTAAAAVGIHPAAVALGGPRFAGGDRADGEYRAFLHPEIPVVAAAGSARAAAVRAPARMAV